MFIGSPEAGPRAAILYSAVASAVRHNLDVWAYLCDVLRRLACAHASDFELPALLPDAWAKAHPEAIRAHRTRERETQAAAKRTRRQRRLLLAQAEARPP